MRLSWLNAAASAWATGRNLVKEVKDSGRKLFAAVRYGVIKGISAALGREMPRHLSNPFADMDASPPEPDLKTRLIALLEKAGADPETAAAVVGDMADRLEASDARLTDLQADKEDLEKQVMHLKEQILDLSQRLKKAEDPARIEKIVTESLLKIGAIERQVEQDAPALH